MSIKKDTVVFVMRQQLNPDRELVCKIVYHNLADFRYKIIYDAKGTFTNSVYSSTEDWDVFIEYNKSNIHKAILLYPELLNVEV